MRILVLVLLAVIKFRLVYNYSSFIDKCLLRLEEKEESSLISSQLNKEVELGKLEIFTLNEQSFEEEKIVILTNCEISESWNLEKSTSFFEDVDNIYEMPTIPRRSFRVQYTEDNIKQETGLNKKKIIINKIELFEEERIADGKSSIVSVDFPFSLEPGNSFDFYIDYNCNSEWTKITIRLHLVENLIIDFGYIKICANNTRIITNPTYIFLVILFILISYLCEKDYLTFNIHIIKINPEEIIAVKYAEYITIYALIILSILILIGILTLFKEFSYAAGFIISLISIKFVVKSTVALFNPNFDEKVSNTTWLINSRFDLILSLSKIIYYSIAMIILVTWLIFFNNLFLMNLIAFSISYLVIKKFYFRNFYFILFLYFLVTMYNFIWMKYNPTSYTDTFNYTCERIINIPISFIFPELIKTPYGTRYFFSILDIILIGFLLEYLKRTKIDGNYLKYGRYGLYSGLVLNLFSFYVFKYYFPFFVLPGMCMILIVVGNSILRKEFNCVFVHLDKQDKYLKSKIVREYPLTIIGADQSHDYNDMINIGRYVPPYIVINEIDDNIEESPRDADFLKEEKGQINTDTNKDE